MSENCPGSTTSGRSGNPLAPLAGGERIERELQIFGRPLEAIRRRFAVDQQDRDLVAHGDDDGARLSSGKRVVGDLHLDGIGARRREADFRER